MGKSKSGIHSPFLLRTIRALGYESILDLTLASGIPYDDIADLDNGSRGPEFDHSLTWQAIAAHTDHRLGELMAVREELVRKIAIERRQRIERRGKIQCR